MEEEEDMLRNRFAGVNELSHMRPSFAYAANDETFNDSAPGDDWEKRHEEMARLLAEEHRKFGAKGDPMDDLDDEDEGGLGDDDVDAVPIQQQDTEGGSFFGFNTSLEHLRGARLEDLEEEMLSRVSRLDLEPTSNGSINGAKVPDSLNEETFGDDGLEGSETAWDGLGKDDDVGDEGATETSSLPPHPMVRSLLQTAAAQSHNQQPPFGGGPPDPKRVTGMMSLEEIEASLARANPAGQHQHATMGGGSRPPSMPGIDPRFAGTMPPQGLPVNFFAGMGRAGAMPPPDRQPMPPPSGPWQPVNQPPVMKHQFPHNAAGMSGAARPLQQQPQYGNNSFRVQTPNEEQQRYVPTKQRWKEHFERMSAYDINTIVRLHSAHMPMPLPFNEDYYYQSYLAARHQGKRPVAPHTPLCETQPWPSRRPTGDGTDPFKYALGRIPNHSVRSPRPLLQLEAFLDQRVIGRRNREVAKAEDQQQPQQQPQQGETWNSHGVLLRVEAAFNLALDVEDIDLLLTNPAVEPQAGMNLLNKRREISAKLFSLLGINTQPPMAPRNLPAFDFDEDREPTYGLPEDELLVKLAQVPKGCRMLARVVPLLSQAQVVYIVYAFIRNLHHILTSPKTKDEMMASSRLSFALSQAISGLQLAPLTVCLHMFISFAQIEAFKTKSGLLVLRSIFTRAYQLASQVRSVPPQHGTEMAELSMWEATFAGFMEAMSGYCCALLRLAADEDDQLASPMAPPEGSIFVGLVHVWDFLLLLTLHTSPAQKEAVFAEVREPLEEALVNPARAQHRPAIIAFLQRMQKDHLYASFLHRAAAVGGGGGPQAGGQMPPGMGFPVGPPPSALPSFAGLSASAQ